MYFMQTKLHILISGSLDFPNIRIVEGLPLMTASGRNLISGSLMRNERAPRWGVATIEHAEQGFDSPMLHQKTLQIKACKVFSCLLFK